MEEQWQEALNGFDNVWQRVQGGEAPGPQPAEDQGRAALEALIGAAAQTAENYRSTQLQRLAGECLADLHRLRAAYFLSYGETFAPSAPVPAEGDLPRRLRQAYRGEKTLAECCNAAAITAGDAELRTLCAAVAERSGRRRAALFELLCRALG